mmetsp:Transcript_78241/g.239294  ORF Transcript_78241/g.239294 Transcript_78241/m.239294 type:complete len:83 (-) Transcript_78241:384-632(-)
MAYIDWTKTRITNALTTPGTALASDDMIFFKEAIRLNSRKTRNARIIRSIFNGPGRGTWQVVSRPMLTTTKSNTFHPERQKS